MKKIITLSILTATYISAAAYKLPEQSFSATAMSAAVVASCDNADCAYYNSANISFLDDNKQFIDTGVTFIHLPSIDFKGKQNIVGEKVPASAKTEIENIPIGYLHYVSKAYGNFRYALSLNVPGGLSKRWKSPVQKLYAQEFTLKTVQVNPSVSYKVNKNLAIAIGASIVYSEGKVYSDGEDVLIPFKREMKGDSIDYGYNLSLSYRLDNGFKLASTYKSKTKLTEKGKANLYIGGVGSQYTSKVNIYLPATFTLALSKNFGNLEVELDYERTFWSSYKSLDFEYDRSIPKLLEDSFDKPKIKNWKDTNSYRIGLKYKYSNKLILMAGYSFDETPIKDNYLSYELPDSNAHVLSLGFKYKYNNNLTLGIGTLYDYKIKRRVNASKTGIDGIFSKGGALLITTGLEYKF